MAAAKDGEHATAATLSPARSSASTRVDEALITFGASIAEPFVGLTVEGKERA
jgi:hypothetical protein